MEVFWARMVHGATERLLLLLGWERRAVSARAGVYATPSKRKVSPTTVGASGGASGASGTSNGASNGTSDSGASAGQPEGFFGTEAPKLNMRPSQPPTHVAGDPYAWNADPFAVGACSGTV